MVRRARHWGEVFVAAFRAGGRIAAFATVLFGGSVLTAAVFLVGFQHRTLAVAVLATGLIGVVLEGSYRVWDTSDKELQRTKARLRELDTVEAKRSFIDQMLEESEAMQADISSVPDEDWAPRRNMVVADIVHWESGVRAALRKSFEKGTDVLFDREEGLVNPEDFVGARLSKDHEIGYLARRSTRLIEIREKL